MTDRSENDVWLNPADSTGYLVRNIHLAFAKSLRRRLLPYDMTTGQYFFLRALWIEEGLSQRELSRRVGTTEPTTASAMRVLEKKGLVRRTRNADDRRTINIYPTDKSLKLKNELLAQAIDVNATAVAGIPAADLERVSALLHTMKDNLGGADD